jgi:hypothetical protein
MDSVLEAVRLARPQTAPPTSAQVLRQRDALLEFIEDSSRAEHIGVDRRKGESTDRPPQRRRARKLIAASTVGIFVVVLVVAITLPRSGSPRAAAAALSHLADTASGQPNPTPTATESLYSKQVGEVLVTLSDVNGVASPGAQAMFPATLETWTRNGIVAYRVEFGDPQFASTAAESAWSKAGLPLDFATPAQIGLGSEPPGITDGSTQSLVMNVSDLPTDPTSLADALIGGHTGIPQLDDIPPGPEAAVQRTALLLMGPLTGVTPQLDAALYNVLAALPGVGLLGPTTTHSGLSGIGFKLPSVGSTAIQERLVVDPSTGMVLEAQNVPFNFGNYFDHVFLPTDELLNQIPEPHTLGSSGPPGYAVWFDEVSDNVIVQDSSIPVQVASVFTAYVGHEG